MRLLGVKLPETAPCAAPWAAAADCAPLAACETSAIAAKTMSMRSAKIRVAEPEVPISTLAISSGAPVARFQTTL